MKKIQATTSPNPAAYIVDRGEYNPIIKVKIPDQWMSKENVEEIFKKLLAEFD